MTVPWHPHVTVATIIENDDKFLMVEEFSGGQVVYNQPAGHLDENETLIEAAIRETLEETGWHISIDALVGFYLFTSAANQVTYFRTLFAGSPIRHENLRPLDQGIVSAPWLSLEQLQANTHKLRSPMVLKCIEDYLQGKRLPLESISHLLP